MVEGRAKLLDWQVECGGHSPIFRLYPTDSLQWYSPVLWRNAPSLLAGSGFSFLRLSLPTQSSSTWFPAWPASSSSLGLALPLVLSPASSVLCLLVPFLKGRERAWVNYIADAFWTTVSPECLRKSCLQLWFEEMLRCFLATIHFL